MARLGSTERIDIRKSARPSRHGGHPDGSDRLGVSSCFASYWRALLDGR